MRIPITMCHGISDSGDHPLSEGHFNTLLQIARELEFTSITYDELADWRGGGELPPRPIMFDFDHPVKSMRHEIHATLERPVTLRVRSRRDWVPVVCLMA